MSEDFFGDLGKSISKYTQTAVDKANVVFESTKITAQISTENREIEKLYQKIGEIVVRRAADGTMDLDSELKNCVEEIQTHNSQILTYKKQLADVKGMKICPSCKELIPKNVAFCPKCGAPTEIEPEEPKEEKKEEAPAVDAEYEEVVDEVKIAQEVAEELQAEEEAAAEAADEDAEEVEVEIEIEAETSKAENEPAEAEADAETEEKAEEK